MRAARGSRRTFGAGLTGCVRVAPLAVCFASLVACGRSPDAGQPTLAATPVVPKTAPSAAPSVSSAVERKASGLHLRSRKDALWLTVRSDGALLAAPSSGSGALVHLWDLERGTVREPIPPVETGFGDVMFSPDGTMFAAAEPRACSWLDVASGAVHRREFAYLEHTAWSPDSHRFVAGSDFGNVDLIDPTTGRSVRARKELTPNPASVASPVALTWSPDSSVIAVEQLGKTSELWDAVTGKTRASFASIAVTFSPDGSRMAVATSSAGLALLDGHTGAQKLSIRRASAGDSTVPPHVAFSANGKTLAWARTGAIEAWDLEHGKLVRALTRPDSSSVQNLAVSNDGRQVAFSTDGDQLFLFASTDTSPPMSLGVCPELSFRHEDGHLACSSTPPRLFDEHTGAALPSPAAFPGPLFGKAAKFFIGPAHDQLIRVEDGATLTFLEVMVNGKRAALAITDDGYFQGDREAARPLLARSGEGAAAEPPTDAELAAHEKPTLVADFAAGSPRSAK